MVSNDLSLSLPLQCNYLERNDLFPGEDVEVVVSAKVTVRRGRLVSLVAASLQVQILANHPRSEVKRRFNLLQDFRITGFTGTVGVDVNRQRLGDADGVGDLHQASSREAGGDDRLGRLSGDVRSGAINLRRILAREGTTTVRTPTPVGVDDDLSTSQTGIAIRTTDDESSRRVQVVDSFVVQVLFRDNLLDDFVHQVFRNLFVRDAFLVLRGDQHGVDAKRDHGTVVVLIFDGDLRLTIRQHPRAGAVLSDDGQSVTQSVRQYQSQRHQRFVFVGGVTKHDTLVTGTDVFQRLGTHAVDALADIRRLLVQSNQNFTRVTVQAVFFGVEADVFADLSHDRFVVNLGGGGDFTENHDHVRLGRGFARDFRIWILGQDGIQDAVGNLIGEFVRVAFVDGFGREEKVFNLLGHLIRLSLFFCRRRKRAKHRGERERGERRLVLFHPKVEKKVIQNRRLSLAVILIKRPSSSSSSSFYDDDASTDAGTHPYIETVSKPNDKKNGFERIRSPRFARVESAKRVARVPVGAMILRVFFVLFARVIDPPLARAVCVVARAKKKRGKNDAFPRVEKPRKRNRATLSRETGGERARVRVPLFVTCVLISDGFWWR